MLDETPVVKKEEKPAPAKKALILIALGGLVVLFALIVYEACVQSGIMKY